MSPCCYIPPPEHCYPVIWWFARMSKARPLRIPRTKKQTETEKDIIAKAEERMRVEKSYLDVNAGITRLLFQCAYLCTIILRCSCLSLTHIFSFSSPCQDSLVCVSVCSVLTAACVPSILRATVRAVEQLYLLWGEFGIRVISCGSHSSSPLSTPHYCNLSLSQPSSPATASTTSERRKKTERGN